MTKHSVKKIFLLILILGYILPVNSFPSFMAFSSVYKTDSMSGLDVDYDSLNITSHRSLKSIHEKSEQTKHNFTGIPIEIPSSLNSLGDKQELDERDDSENTSEDSDKYSDPYGDYNRWMYSINKEIDQVLIKPASQLYTVALPMPVKHMVTNFFSNLFDITVLINDLLQLEFENSSKTLGRFILNSSFGVFGLIDVAKDIGLSKENNDYGITLGKWGMEKSDYFVLPLFGPSTIRDAIGKVIGFATTYGYYRLSKGHDLELFSLFMLDTRANLLTAEKIMDTISEDEYVFVRNSYIQYRDALIRGEKLDKKHEEYEEKLLDDILAVKNNKSDNESYADLNDLKGKEALNDQNLEDLQDLGDLKNKEDLKDLKDLKDSKDLKDLKNQ